MTWVALAKEELHAALRKYYEQTGIDKPVREEWYLNGQYVMTVGKPLKCICSAGLPGCTCDNNPPKFTSVKVQDRQLTPPGVHILGQPRIGDAERDRCLQRLAEMHARGCLDPAEYDARTSAAMKAAVQDELDFLVRDLPGEVPARWFRDISPWISGLGMWSMIAGAAVMPDTAFGAVMFALFAVLATGFICLFTATT